MSRTPTRPSSLLATLRFVLTRKANRANSCRVRLSLRQTIALFLLVSLISPSLARARQLQNIHGASAFDATGTASMFASFSELLTALLGLPQRQNMPRSERPLPDRKAPQLPPTKAEREAKVDGLKLDISSDLTIESGRRRILMAIPLDKDGEPIDGLLAEWESSDKNVISISKDGRAVAGNPGTAKLSVSAGQKKVSVKITVIEADTEPRPIVGRANPIERLREARTARASKHHATSVPPTPQQGQSQGFGARLPDAEASSLYWAQNDVGAPAGRTEPGAATPPAAMAGTETPLSSNFAFGVPLVNLAGRGIDIKLALSYNSRLWHKSIDSGATRMTYDVNSGWPAPGFQLGYGYIESHGATTKTLVDGDGTRHELRKSNSNPYDPNYDTVDGTFIHFTSDNEYYYPTQGWLDRSDGTRVYYSGGGTISYPVQIVDRNGNYILISYSSAGLISTIQDTLGRYITFDYEYDPSQNCGNTTQCFHNSHKLVTIKVPGFGDVCPTCTGGSQRRQAVRFYYDTITINPAGSFAVPTRAPATARVIRYLYFPGTQSGFRYDYSSYGMIVGVKQLRGMTVSTTVATQQGAVTSEGQIAATTSYNYPLTPASLSDAPAFTQRTDDWAGRTSAQPIHNFSVNQAAGTSTITAPNGTITTTQTIAAQGLWNDGLVTDVTQQGGGLAVTAHNVWQPDSGGVNPRLQQTQVTNEANQTKTTQFTYTTYNNVSVIRELGFSNEELRRTETAYETASQWTGPVGPPGYPLAGKRLLRLPTSVKIFAGGASQPASRVDYAYDQDLEPMWRDGIVMHNQAYDPYRGNVTSITSFINAADPNQGTVVDTKDYDIAGNVVAQTANCCRQKAYDYFSGYYFANVTQLTEGDTQHQQNAIYDFSTGLITQSTDQNGQVTTYEYYPDSLRLYRVTRPDGSTTIMEYGNLLYADPDQSHLHSWTKTTTSIEGSMVSEEWKYIDGRGQVVRTFGTQTTQGRATRDIEYDAMGRILRNSNPYYSQSGAASAINPAGIWASRLYDALSRVTQETLPDSTTAQAAYAGNVMTVTDQSNKSRRRITDALGQLARMDEPDASGNLGSVSSPLQPTSYQYDALDNLVHITQGAQHRYFKYDSLSQMTYERQPEQDAPHTATDALTGNNNWSRKIDYNGFSLVSQVTDARGVATNFAYDTLNRLTLKVYSDGSPSVQYSYDEPRTHEEGGDPYSNRGRLTTVSTGGSGQIYQQFNYNRMGKVAMQRQSAGGSAFEIQYSYNPGGLLIEEWIRGELPMSPPNYLWNYSLDEKRSFFYDAAGRLTSVNRGSHSTPQAAYASGFSYNAAGALESLTYGNGAVETKGYNSRLQLTNQSLVKAGTVLQRYDYQYGQVNQLTGAVDALKNNGQLGRTDGFIGGAPQSPVKQWDERFSYDALGRLDIASEYRGDNATLTWRADYDYDRYGNRSQNGGQNTNLTYVPVPTSEINTANNRLTANVTYDAAGQTLTDGKFRGLQYQYNPEGRMKWSANLDGSNPSTSVYDGLGQRAQTTQGGVTKSYFYDVNGSVVAEYEANGGTSYGALKRLNISAGGRLLAVDEVQTGGTKVTSYLMADQQGSTRVLMDAAGAVTSRHDYLPFGEELGAGTGMRSPSQGYSAADNVRQRYADTRLDDATGLDHTLWRKLETRSGRWTTPDPYGGSMKTRDPQTFNRYSHVNNDPVNFIDSSGLNVAATGILTIGKGYCYFVSDLINPDPEMTDGKTHLVGGGCMGGDSVPGDVTGGGGTEEPGLFDDAYRDCKGSLGTAAAPGLSQAAAIVQAADSTGVDRTLLAFTWYEESGGFNFNPTNGIHGSNELIGDIGPGQIFPGIWDKAPFTDGLYNPFGTNREVGQVFNGDPTENLILTGRALNHPLGAVRGDKRGEAAGLYKAGSKSGPGYQTRVDKWNKADVKAYDNFFGCLRQKGF